MHECPECGQTCDCDCDDTWCDWDWPEASACIHRCAEPEDADLPDADESS